MRGAGFGFAARSQCQNSHMHRLAWLIDRLISLNRHLPTGNRHLWAISLSREITDMGPNYVAGTGFTGAGSHVKDRNSVAIRNGLALVALHTYAANRTAVRRMKSEDPQLVSFTWLHQTRSNHAERKSIIGDMNQTDDSLHRLECRQV